MTSKSKPKKEEPSQWFPIGMYELNLFKLSDTQRKHLIDVICAHDNPQKDRFLHAVEMLIGSYIAGKQFSEHASRTRVEERMKELEKKTHFILKAINELDDYSHYLLWKIGRGPDWTHPATMEDRGVLHVGAGPNGTPIVETRKGYTFNEASIAVGQLYGMTTTVLKEINKYPKSKRPNDWSRINLAKDVKNALVTHLGLIPDANADGIFSRTLREIMEYANIPCKSGIDPKTRDVRSLVKIALGD